MRTRALVCESAAVGVAGEADALAVVSLNAHHLTTCASSQLANLSNN